MLEGGTEKSREGQRHTFVGITRCKLCQCKLGTIEIVRVSAPPGPCRDMSINSFRRSLAILLDERPICEDCEQEVADFSTIIPPPM